MAGGAIQLSYWGVGSYGGKSLMFSLAGLVMTFAQEIVGSGLGLSLTLVDGVDGQRLAVMVWCDNMD